MHLFFTHPPASSGGRPERATKDGFPAFCTALRSKSTKIGNFLPNSCKFNHMKIDKFKLSI
jgi:hypothetical protein